MKTLVEIPEQELEEAMQHTGAGSQQEAIVVALTDFNRRRRLERLAEQLGSFDGFLSPEELQHLRQAD